MITLGTEKLMSRGEGPQLAPWEAYSPRPTLFPLILGLIVAGLIAIWIV